MLAAIVTDIFTIICISSFNYMISMRDLISAQEKKAKAFWDQIFKEGLHLSNDSQAIICISSSNYMISTRNLITTQKKKSMHFEIKFFKKSFHLSNDSQANAQEILRPLHLGLDLIR